MSLCECYKSVFTASTTAPPLKQKGKIPVQEAKTPESPKLKSKVTRLPKEKEPEPEVIKLKKVPVKPPEPEKEVITHRVEVTRHQDVELTVHGLHDREDRDIITLGRTEQVFTAEEETAQLSQFEEAERVSVVQKTEKEGWTRTPKPPKEEEPEEPKVDKKKITKLPKADEQKDSAKLKPFEKLMKPEEEPQKIQLKKVPTKPKEPEKEVKTQRVEMTRLQDVELTVHGLHDRDDRDIITLGRTERVFTAEEETAQLGYFEEVEKVSVVEKTETEGWTRTPKPPKEEEPEVPKVEKKKITKLPKADEQKDSAKLKPFEKSGKPEEEPQKIQLKKVPTKPKEPEKEVITHKIEVTRHQDVELTIHGLHDRDDREIITVGRTERVFTAEEETAQLGYFEEVEKVSVVEKTEKQVWTRTPKPQKEEEPEVPKVQKKKITKLPKADEQKDSAKLKPFEKSRKPEEEPQKIQLKKVPTKPKEPEKEVITQRVEVTRHYDAEMTVQKLHEREDREILTLGRTERVFTAAEEASELGQREEPEKLEAEDEKSKWIRTPKAPKGEEPEPDLTKKKIKKLPKKEEEQEEVTLKPFVKPEKPETAEPAKAKKEGEAKTDTERTPFKGVETPQRDLPATAVKHRQDEDAPLTSPEVSPDVTKDQKEIPQVVQIPKDEESTAADKLRGKPKIISTPDKEKEPVMLKPFTKVTKPEEKPDKAPEEDKTKHADTKVPSRTPREGTPKELKEEQLRKVEKTSTPKKEDEKPQKKEEPAVPPKKPSPPGKKEAEKEIPQKQSDILKKGVELKKTPSPRVGKDTVEEEKTLKPLEQLKKVELKKTPSPKVDKPKPKELEPVEKKPSAEKVKRSPKTVSPKDSVEAVTLRKVPKKPSPEEAPEPEEPSKGRIPLVKEVSPGAVQMKKVPTQPEEEVFQEEAEVMEGEEEEEAWGWELVPPDDWEGEVVDGAVETPGMPGAKRGETKADKLQTLEPLIHIFILK
ncbi:uncharacterized protein LOC141782002 [Sebastes fasciatus]|uniref:uncharacterized protein LOC141782002 n=1 Tax=Sebastes fasciatus TaxID=394691 RepID=UPI003D9F28D1